MGRARRAGFGDKAIDFSPASAEQQKALEAQSAMPVPQTVVPADTAYPPPMEIYKAIEAEVTDALEKSKYPPDLQRRGSFGR